MIINHNITALNTHRQLGAATNAQTNSMEKLSSGMRINKASDDAAGLSISEKMRGQIRGLEQASANAQDGISLLQTAEGALNETHDILQRMRELAVQSSNDTNTDTDRGELQKEVDQLAKEITRIAENTEFNTKKLINGAADTENAGTAFTFQIGANSGQSISVDIKSMTALSLEVSGAAAEEGAAAITGTYTAATQSGDEKVANSLDAGTFSVTGNVDDGFKLLDGDDNEVASSTDGITFTGDGKDIDDDGTDGNALAADAVVAEKLVLTGAVTEGATITIAADGKVTTAAAEPEEEEVDPDAPAAPVGSVGTSETVTGINISTQGSANTAIDVINSAIETVSAERSKLGSFQNRLDHTINNLNTSAENLTSAESRIRDVDMAKEMMEQTKNSILAQASQAMLAQSNQMPQAVLQLLR